MDAKALVDRLVAAEREGDAEKAFRTFVTKLIARELGPIVQWFEGENEPTAEFGVRIAGVRLSVKIDEMGRAGARADLE